MNASAGSQQNISVNDTTFDNSSDDGTIYSAQGYETVSKENTDDFFLTKIFIQRA